MSLYAFTTAALQGLNKNFWGAKIPIAYQADEQGNVTAIEGGQTQDTGVQAAITELVGRLQSTSPIQLAGSLQMVQPANAPGIVLQQNQAGLNSTAIQFADQFGNPVNLGFNGQMSNGAGLTGSFTLLTGASISVVGCVATVNGTTVSLTFQNGLLVGVK